MPRSSSSYQHSFPGGTSARNENGDVRIRNATSHSKIWVAAVACAVLGALMLFSGSSNNNTDPNLVELERTGERSWLWESSHSRKHHEHHHKHHHKKHGKKSLSPHEDPSKFHVQPSLQLKGYPSLSVQEEYMKALQEIDWDAVEQDIEDVLTDSQDCR
jgi:G3E family GTPase